MLTSWSCPYPLLLICVQLGVVAETPPCVKGAEDCTVRPPTLCVLTRVLSLSSACLWSCWATFLKTGRHCAATRRPTHYTRGASLWIVFRVTLPPPGGKGLRWFICNRRCWSSALASAETMLLRAAAFLSPSTG